jgi:hypothetical protein
MQTDNRVIQITYGHLWNLVRATNTVVRPWNNKPEPYDVAQWEKSMNVATKLLLPEAKIAPDPCETDPRKAGLHPIVQREIAREAASVGFAARYAPLTPADRLPPYPNHEAYMAAHKAAQERESLMAKAIDEAYDKERINRLYDCQAMKKQMPPLINPSWSRPADMRSPAMANLDTTETDYPGMTLHDDDPSFKTLLLWLLVAASLWGAIVLLYWGLTWLLQLT